jgi:Tti2 family
MKVHCLSVFKDALIQGVDYERLWHLMIPPILTFLDDYEAPYKLLGVRMVSEMFKTVPKDLLKRTGIDGLLLSVRAIIIPISTFPAKLFVNESMSHATLV